MGEDKGKKITPVALRPGPWGQATGLARGTVYNLLNSGAIQARKCGGATLITTPPAEFLASLPTYEPQAK